MLFKIQNTYIDPVVLVIIKKMNVIDCKIFVFIMNIVQSSFIFKIKPI